ncbi:hypothetical protein ACWDYJ_35725 [Streptomyces sp. NPDC003042]
MADRRKSDPPLTVRRILVHFTAVAAGQQAARAKRLAKAADDLEKLAGAAGGRHYKTREKIVARIGVVTAKRRVTSSLRWHITADEHGTPGLTWHFDQDVLKAEQPSTGRENRGASQPAGPVPNRAATVGEADGPRAGLTALEAQRLRAQCARRIDIGRPAAFRAAAPPQPKRRSPCHWRCTGYGVERFVWTLRCFSRCWTRLKTMPSCTTDTPATCVTTRSSSTSGWIPRATSPPTCGTSSGTA